MATINTRSVRGKSAELLQHELEENIALCVVTENLLRAYDGDVVRGELSQDCVWLSDVLRPDRKGGGIVLLY
ncbi:hypothetical protein DPMN_148300 [Dreissena polymorpha]|uniref:Uncharacterized protein n=1 Tax=Dreissena polymorpha TaxID=45954 RepID=A0A9D4FF98_DREPO|nr:hypothetical protein DPMN_148300 [Dreissena polymorpha]